MEVKVSANNNLEHMIVPHDHIKSTYFLSVCNSFAFLKFLVAKLILQK